MPSRAATTSLPRRAFVACLYAGCATGSFYGFGIYGGAIQSSLGLSDASLANINTVPYALGFVSAPLAGRVTKAFGPAAGLLLGGAIQAALQVAMYAIATGAAPTGAIDPGTALVLCACVVYVGGQLISSAAFSTPVLHFRRKRGRVVSLVKAFVGLSGAVVSQTYVVAFGVPSREPGALRCLLIWAAISAGTCFFGAACIPRSPSQQSREPAALLRLCFWLLLLLCGASMAASLVPQTGSPLHTGLVGLLGLLALSPLPLALGPLLPLLAPARSRASPGGRAFPSPRRAPLLAGPEAALPWLSQPPPAPPSGGAGEANDGSPGEEAAEEAARREAAGGPVRRARAAGAEPEPFLLTEARTQLSLPQMLRRPDSWLLWLAGCAAIGGGNFFATNVGQLVRASGSHPQLVAQLVTLFSTGNMLGRLVGCDASDRLFVRRGRLDAEGRPASPHVFETTRVSRPVSSDWRS